MYKSPYVMVIEWVAGAGTRSAAARLIAVIFALFALSFIVDVADGRLTTLWWMLPIPPSILLAMGFVMWRLMKRIR